MEFYGEIKFKGTLADGTGDPLLTKDATSDEVGTAANALGTLTSANIFVGNASNVPTGVAVTGDISMSNAGVTAIVGEVIVNADINGSAAIAVSKLAALTASRAIVSDGSGFLSVSAVTSTELGYVSGVTSAIQTQLNAKQATITGGATTITSSDLTANRALISSGTGKVAVASVTATELGYVSGVTSAIQTQLNTKLAPTITSVAEGDILYYNGSAWVNLPRGTDGQTLRSSSTTILWDTPTINGIPVGGSNNQVLAKQSATDFDADWETLVVASITDLTATAAELNVLDGITATVTELNYTDGVSSNIQTQLDGKLSTSLPQNAIFVGNSSNVATSLSGGTNGYVLTSVSGVPTWAAVSAGTPPGADTQMIFNDGGSFGVDTGFVYNKTTNTLTVANLDTATTIGSAAIYRVSGTDVAVADGGTGLSAIAALSILVANSANTYVALTPGAGNSLRVNAGGTAWEAYTGIGGSTGSVDNAILRANGTGGVTLQSSPMSVDDDGDLFLGTSSLGGTNRVVAPVSSGGTATLQLQDEVGTGVLIIGNEQLNFTDQGGGSILNVATSTNNVEMFLYGDTNSLIGGLPGSAATSTGHSGDLTLAGGDGSNDDANGGNLYLRGGTPNGSGTAGFVVVSDNAFYIGGIVDGGWRFLISGDDLLIQQRETGSYVTKSTISGA